MCQLWALHVVIKRHFLYLYSYYKILVDNNLKIDETLKLNVTVSCQKKVRAYKRFLIHTPPNVLTLQLKRYVSGAAGYKLNRHLNFSMQLDLRPFMTEVNDSSVIVQALCCSGSLWHDDNQWPLLLLCVGTIWALVQAERCDGVFLLLFRIEKLYDVASENCFLSSTTCFVLS